MKRLAVGLIIAALGISSAASSQTPGGARAPAQLTGKWQCMRSIVSASSMYQPMLTFTLAPGSWTDLTFGPAKALKGKASYLNGQLKLYSAKGSLLHTLRWTPAGDGGASDRLVEVLGPNDTARAGEVCYPSSASAASVKEKPGSEQTGLRRGGDPFNAFDYPAHVIVACACDEIPVKSVVTFRLTPAAGGAARIFTRTVGQLRTSPLPSFKVPLDETATLVVPVAGRYRVSAELRMPDGGTVPLRMGDELEAELEWTGTYYDGAKYLSVIPVG